MAFLPIDLQVNVMQSSNVANAASHEQEAPKLAREDRADQWIERRRLDENTSDETGQSTAEDQTIDEEGQGNSPNREFEGESEPEDEESSSQNARSHESDKGNYMDFTT